ncbi:hypothetical protein ORV05_16315 [Amycolatopsis cynarae]|uniref:DUF2867 domain-containing protein n=1 Tax=Amycolatopsis cynarae TaxID=2995223 RepID=A0ABY7BDD2_9PSEU|nr:hypothetical protein [Amycolatopsis sp. HUAS 11-8]WAL69262.1 hypothetical protein ORV05_16315 [Amycolatopsis sp. HUAS 11-8]
MGTADDRMLIESAVPTFDAMIAEHAVVYADRATTFEAARNLDFLTVRTPLLTAAFWVRDLPSRLSGGAAPDPPELVLSEGIGLRGWLLLGEREGQEIAFGAVGKFWRPAIVWRDVPREEFAGFSEPGWGKMAANFSVQSYGNDATLLSYQCRTVTTDLASRRRFLRYWRLVRPLARHVLRATLRTIQLNAEAAAVRPPEPEGE